MAFKLCEAFVEFQARTQGVSDGVQKVKQEVKAAQAEINAGAGMGGAGGGGFGFGAAAIAGFAALEVPFVKAMSDAVGHGHDLASSFLIAGQHMLGLETSMERFAKNSAEASRILTDMAKNAGATSTLVNKL